MATKYEGYEDDNTGLGYVHPYLVANTFTVGTTGTDEDFNITSVKVLVYRVGSPGTINFAITEVDGDSLPTGGDLSTGSAAGNDWTDSTSGDWEEITMTSYTLSASTQYAIVFRMPDSSSNNNPKWRADSSNSYGGGNFLDNNDGAGWTSHTSYCISFEVWGDAAAAAGTNFQVQVDDVLRDVDEAYVQVDDVFRTAEAYVNKDDVWRA